MLVQLNSIQLNFERVHPQQNADSSRVLVFLHEALGSLGQWKDFPQRLCDTLNTEGIVYERQGHGLSSKLEAQRTNRYLHDYALRELPEFLAAIGETRDLILIGHSDGGTMALLAAAQKQLPIQGIVTLAAHVINEPETVAGIQPAVVAYESGKLDGLKKYHGDKTDKLFYAWAEIWQDASFQRWNIIQEIEAASCSGLFLQGKEDQYGTAKQLEYIQAHFGGKSEAVLIDSCGHHPHLEQQALVIERIHGWWIEQKQEIRTFEV